MNTISRGYQWFLTKLYIYPVETLTLLGCTLVPIAMLAAPFRKDRHNYWSFYRIEDAKRYKDQVKRIRQGGSLDEARKNFEQINKEVEPLDYVP
jgi:hypothetical protein